MAADRREFLGSMLGVGMVSLVGKTGGREEEQSPPVPLGRLLD